MYLAKDGIQLSLPHAEYTIINVTFHFRSESFTQCFPCRHWTLILFAYSEQVQHSYGAHMRIDSILLRRLYFKISLVNSYSASQNGSSSGCGWWRRLLVWRVAAIMSFSSHVELRRVFSQDLGVGSDGLKSPHHKNRVSLKITLVRLLG
jgi:hypothetical protein